MQITEDCWLIDAFGWLVTFCWLEGTAAADKSLALILWVETEPLTGTGAGGLGGEGSWVRGVMEDMSLASMEELELGSGLKF